jgi:hypothetical protein
MGTEFYAGFGAAPEQLAPLRPSSNGFLLGSLLPAARHYDFGVFYMVSVDGLSASLSDLFAS